MNNGYNHNRGKIDYEKAERATTAWKSYDGKLRRKSS